MYDGFSYHKKGCGGSFLFPLLGALLICSVVAGCAERPPNAIGIDNASPLVTILLPSDGLKILLDSSKVQNGTEIAFQGYGIDPEEDTLGESSLHWTSDIDGEIGTGSSFIKSDLSAGEHTIVLTATDSEEGTGRDTVRVAIGDETLIENILNEEPVAEILSIADTDLLDEGLSLLSDATLLLKGTAEDLEDGLLEGESLVWSSDLDGELGKGEQVDATGLLSRGDHTITLAAIDSDGAIARDSAVVSIEEAIEEVINELPVVDILSLEEGLSLLSDAELLLDGTAEDLEDGLLVGESLVWSSDLDGELGKGEQVDATGLLSLGDHTITLAATDSDGATGTASVNISIEEILPIAPSDLTAEVDGSTGLQLSWQDNSDNETHFNVEQSLDGTSFELAATVGENSTSTGITGLEPETPYMFRVSAENSVGESDYSNLVEIETLPAEITRLVTGDNTLDSSAGDENIADGTLPVGKLLNLDLESEYRAALQFTGLQDDISGRTIENAVLWLYPRSSLNADVYLAVNAFAEKWNTTEITWNTQPSPLRLETGPVEVQAVLNLGEPLEFDITGIVSNWAEGSWEVNGLRVMQSTSDLLDVAAEFESLETGGTEFAPQIIIYFGD